MSSVDLPLILTIVGFFLSLVGVLLFFLFEDRKRTEVVTKLEARIDRLDGSTAATIGSLKDEMSRLDRTAHELLNSAAIVVRDMQDVRSASQQLRPDFTTFVSNQWRIFDRMARYRHEKLLISRKIAMDHIRLRDTVLLDSGSTTDQVTAELLTCGAGSVNVFSNNVLAALHLAGTSAIRFYLLGGQFFERSWAVYSDDVSGRLDQLGITVFVLAAATFRMAEGLMCRIGEDGNRQFKRGALVTFWQHADTRLVIAIDASKFCHPLAGHEPVVPRRDWSQIVRSCAARITIVTSAIPTDTEATQRAAIQREIDRCTEAGVRVEIAGTS